MNHRQSTSRPDEPNATRPAVGPAMRVLVADGHHLLRDALCVLLAREKDLVTVEQAPDGDTAIALTRTCRPDVVLLDLKTPGPGPVATVVEIKAAHPNVRVIALASHEDQTLRRWVIEAGAEQYLSKESSYDALVCAIRGGRSRPADTLNRTSLPRSPLGDLATVLTPREAEIMVYVAQALSNRQIGRLLSIAEDTVKRHLRNVFKKLNVGSRVEAVNLLFGGTSGGLHRMLQVPPTELSDLGADPVSL
ncbi:LuxR C-terminal-related transcriptional regulator [Streptomyces odontomachi]|uniref:LuxR C-terminal-related transcriptional regulator n=1 Tax=Streptomyces odontomachi TaxID=2944940 RepID=UPI0021088DFD|nr:response regulator transcription factor [Streptomyces sp. ODS25]